MNDFFIAIIFSAFRAEFLAFVGWILTNYKLSDYSYSEEKANNGQIIAKFATAKGVPVPIEAPKIFEVARNCVLWLMENRDVIIRDHIKTIDYKEQEVLQLRKLLRAFESTGGIAENIISTPARGNNLDSPYPLVAQTPLIKSSMQGENNVLSTPTSSSVHVSTRTPTSSRLTGARALSLQVSPAAKQAARLQSEVVKEVRT